MCLLKYVKAKEKNMCKLNILRKIAKNRLNLAETLTEAQKEVLQKYDDTVTEMNDIMERELFIYAFRLGGRFMLETLSNEG